MAQIVGGRGVAHLVGSGVLEGRAVERLIVGSRVLGGDVLIRSRHSGTGWLSSIAGEAGATALTHLPDTEAVPEDVARTMAELGVISIPTGHTEMSWLIGHPEVLARPLARATTTGAVLAAYGGSVVVLEASPLEDITKTQRIWAVVHHRTLVDREELIRKAGPTR